MRPNSVVEAGISISENLPFCRSYGTCCDEAGQRPLPPWCPRETLHVKAV